MPPKNRLPPSKQQRIPALKELGLEDEDPEVVFNVHGRKGTGAFGAVFRASYKTEPHLTVAIKIIKVALKAGQHGEEIENVKKEIQFLRECDHPNVTKFFGAYYKDESLWIAMEYCGGGSVGDLARSRKFTAMEIAVILREALKGLAYLHSKKKIHRDIKGGNILLTEAGRVKIADFGVSAQLRDTMSRRGTFVGTPYWMSPEMIQDSEYDYKADVWSLGITAIELADQKPPLFDEHPMRVLLRIPRNPPPKLAKPDDWDPDFSAFLAFVLTKDPHKRPSAVESLEHEFITSTSHIEGVMSNGTFVLVNPPTSVSITNTTEEEEKTEVGLSAEESEARIVSGATESWSSVGSTKARLLQQESEKLEAELTNSDNQSWQNPLSDLTSNSNAGVFISSPTNVSHNVSVSYDPIAARYEGGKDVPPSWNNSTLHQQFGISLSETHFYKDTIPSLLDMISRELVFQDGLFVEGIFRIGADKHLLNQARREIDDGSFDTAHYVNDPHLYAGLIKLWFRELKPQSLLQPIGASGISRLAILLPSCVTTEVSTAESDMANAEILDIISSLSHNARAVLDWLLKLCVTVSDHSRHNRMTCQSLSIVLAPNLYNVLSEKTEGDATNFARQVASGIQTLIQWKKQRQEAEGNTDDNDVISSFIISPRSVLPNEPAAPAVRRVLSPINSSSVQSKSKSGAAIVQARVDAFLEALPEDNTEVNDKLFQKYQEVVFNAVEQWGSLSEKAWATHIKSIATISEDSSDNYQKQQELKVPTDLKKQVGRWISASVNKSSFESMISSHLHAKSLLKDCGSTTMSELLLPSRCHSLWNTRDTPSPFCNTSDSTTAVVVDPLKMQEPTRENIIFGLKVKQDLTCFPLLKQEQRRLSSIVKVSSSSSTA